MGSNEHALLTFSLMILALEVWRLVSWDVPEALSGCLF